MTVGLEEQVACDTLERYSGSKVQDFCSYVLLTNFPYYVEHFAKLKNVPVYKGSMFEVAHSPKDDISILDFKIGSPAAALVADLCGRIPSIQGCLLLGMCGGLRSHYKVGEYLVPTAGIRDEKTSDFYFPPEVPAMANFFIQRVVSEVLDEEKAKYYIGIAHSTNIRFWEFDDAFRKRLAINRAQCIEMECATLFMASYKYRLPLGALLLISDVPLTAKGVKTKESSLDVFTNYTPGHIELGVKILHAVRVLHKRHCFVREPYKKGS